MTIRADCLLHVGYMKTATTYLQASVFNNENIGLGVPLDGKGRGLIVKEVILSDGYSFDKLAASERLEAAAAPLRERDLIPVWSDETFLGEPVTRRYDGYVNALRLHSILPNAKVLITIREQKALAYSMYVEYLRQDGLVSLEGFIGTGNEDLSMSPILRSDYLFYDRAVSFYHRIFGKDNVLVLPYELLKVDRAAYFSKLARFIGVEIDLDRINDQPVHRSVGATANLCRYATNRIKTPHPLSNRPSQWGRLVDRGIFGIDKLIPRQVDRAVEAMIHNRIGERYKGLFRDSNIELKTITRLDLPSLGYEC